MNTFLLPSIISEMGRQWQILQPYIHMQGEQDHVWVISRNNIRCLVCETACLFLPGQQGAFRGYFGGSMPKTQVTLQNNLKRAAKNKLGPSHPPPGSTENPTLFSQPV